jgi:hypothetical protein
MTAQELYQHLRTKNLYYEIYETEDGFVISVEWGDWKHDHRYLEYIMGELDYILVDKKITNEDGSDCYSADHYYKKMGVM